ncbi:helix-turn-helix domain-containing protein [Tengunoibacter tsumagoiensis]|uniref:HTH cro/C1-type domain-containing protein n=1 Tax=Tengunoibacter tsumagoiensis TaxID=2014871 RepID=A0A402A3T9_9CHLR|nr:helix-turn-helix transcriptional regulator [Tengunoibacter tsumagoiensis]GCE13813.1 hypothetical protein KTT_36720 [Tengunoibacter tsumagoiensis]
MAVPNKSLEKARMQKRWSIAVASERVGVSVNTFNRWERGLQVPQLSTLDQLCKAFDLSPEALGFAHAVTVKRRASANPDRANPDKANPDKAIPGAPASAEPPSRVERASFNLPPSSTPFVEQPISPRPSSEQKAIPMIEPRSLSDAHHCFEQAKRSVEHMWQLRQKKSGGEGHSALSRRKAIVTLVGAPAAVFGVAQAGQNPVLHPEEVLSLCSIGIPLAWQLYFEGGLSEVECVLPKYMAQLRELVQSSPTQYKRITGLLSQGFQLTSLLALQRQNFGVAHTSALQALEYGEQTQDPNLETASLIRLAQVFFYLKRPIQRLQAYERAVQYSQKVSPLLQGRVYIGLTEACAQLNQEYKAQSYLDLAHAVYPLHCENDPNFSYTHFNRWSLSSFEGLMHLHLGHPRQSWSLYEKMSNEVTDALVPNRVELIVRQAEAAVALGDREQACTYVKAAVNSAREVNNQLRYDETCSIYGQMCQDWGRDYPVRSLDEYFLP